MFTGIIHHTATISGLHQDSHSMQLRIDTQFHDLQLGESIAVDGLCLTVTAISGGTFDAELSPETLRLTHASQYQRGQSVNVERAMQLQDRFGGHYVTGHVDGTLQVESVQPVGEFIEIIFNSVKPEHAIFLVKKGSITINGVSLTVNALGDDSVSVMLIPHTLEITNLNDLQPGHRVNVEYDPIAKWVSRYVELYVNVTPAKAGGQSFKCLDSRRSLSRI